MLPQRKWDGHCTFMAITAPLFILLSWVLPGQVKAFLGPVFAAVAFLLTLSSPPTGLYIALVAILYSPALLLSSDTSGGSWGKICAAAVIFGLLPGSHSGAGAIRLPRSTWYFLFLFMAIILSAIHTGSAYATHYYILLVVDFLIFLLVYNCTLSRDRLYVFVVCLVSLADIAAGIAFISGNTSWRIMSSTITELNNANNLGLFMGFVLPLCIYIAMNEYENTRVRMWGWASFAACAFTFLWAASRGAAVGLLSGWGVWLIIMRRTKRKSLLPLLVIVASFFALPAATRDYTLQHFLNQTAGSQAATTQRLYVLLDGFQSIMKSPLLGYGLGASRHVLGANWQAYGGGLMNPHNTYLMVALDLGLFGLITFVGLVFTSITGAIQLVNTGRTLNDKPLELLGGYLTTALCVLAIGSFFLGNFQDRIWYVALGLSAAAQDIDSRRDHRSVKTGLGRSIRLESEAMQK